MRRRAKVQFILVTLFVLILAGLWALGYAKMELSFAMSLIAFLISVLAFANTILKAPDARIDSASIIQLLPRYIRIRAIVENVGEEMTTVKGATISGRISDVRFRGEINTNLAGPDFELRTLNSGEARVIELKFMIDQDLRNLLLEIREVEILLSLTNHKSIKYQIVEKLSDLVVKG